MENSYIQNITHIKKYLQIQHKACVSLCLGANSSKQRDLKHEIEAIAQIPHPLCMGVKFSTPRKTLIINFPSPRDGKGVKCPEGGMLKLRFDRYISTKVKSVLTEIHSDKNKIRKEVN